MRRRRPGRPLTYAASPGAEGGAARSRHRRHGCGHPTPPSEHPVPGLPDSKSVTGRDKGLEVRRFMRDIGHADLDVHDRLGGQTGHGGRSDVVHSQSLGAERVLDATAVFSKMAGQLGRYGSMKMARFSGPPISSTSSTGPVWLVQPSGSSAQRREELVLVVGPPSAATVEAFHAAHLVPHLDEARVAASTRRRTNSPPRTIESLRILCSSWRSSRSRP